MAQEQNYQVNYVINVEATQGTKQVMAFAESVSKLTQAKASLAPAVQNIRNMMEDIDKAFRTKNGKKRDYSFKMNIDTSKTEEKLTRVKGMLTEIRELSRGINLVLNAGQPLDSKRIKAQTKALLNQKALTQNKPTASLPFYRKRSRCCCLYLCGNLFLHKFSRIIPCFYNVNACGQTVDNLFLLRNTQTRDVRASGG